MSSTCPSCGRDAGTNEICPHCSADLQHRVKIRTFGIISIVVAVVGVAILLFFASRTPVPTVNVSDIEATSNYAYVQLHGIVSRAPNYNPDAQSITFWVRDDSGEIMVRSGSGSWQSRPGKPKEKTQKITDIVVPIIPDDNWKKVAVGKKGFLEFSDYVMTVNRLAALWGLLGRDEKPLMQDLGKHGGRQKVFAPF